MARHWTLGPHHPCASASACFTFRGWLLIIVTLADNIRQDHWRLLPNHFPGLPPLLACGS